MSIVATRQNHIPELGLALIPLYDMLNHEPGEITTFFSNERIEVFASKAYSKGDEVNLALLMACLVDPYDIWTSTKL